MKLIESQNGVKYFESDILSCRNAFSTRIGGVSDLPHTSELNLAYGRGDSDETVRENLALFCAAAGFYEKSVVSVPQIHSAKVVRVDSSHRGLGYFKEADFSCDGYVTTDTSVTLGVKTADCVPILMSAKTEDGRVFAVSALHAGWRGTASGIAREGIKALVDLGADPKRIYAAIGPHINACCFEVGADCRDEFVRSLGEWVLDFIDSRGEKFFPDLGAINKKLLTECGLPDKNIDASNLCTYCDPELFYSHRRTNGVRGTHLSAIKMQNAKCKIQN